VHGRTTADALACIVANYPDFAYRTDICLRQFNDGAEIVDHTFAREITELHISPMVSGSGGFGKILLGAALIGASFIPGVGAISIGAAISLKAILFSVGIGLALQGIGQLLAPKPGENETSYIFSDTKTPAKQGDPIPIPIGKFYFILSPYLISGAVDTELVAVNGSGGGKFGK
jgi:predicted phage tail protein